MATVTIQACRRQGFRVRWHWDSVPGYAMEIVAP